MLYCGNYVRITETTFSLHIMKGGVYLSGFVRDTAYSAERPYTEERKGRILWLSLLLLILVFSLSSYTIGYQIGRTVDKGWYSGQIIDTINISSGYIGYPMQVTYQIDIRGQVFYTDGTPYAQGNIELHSDVQYTVTDDSGYFEFNNVSEGEHTIYVINNGVVLAKCDVVIKRGEGIQEIQVIQTEDGGYTIRIPLTITIVDIVLEIDITDGIPSVLLKLNPTQPVQPEFPVDPMVWGSDQRPYVHYTPYIPGKPEDPETPGETGDFGHTDPKAPGETEGPKIPGETETPQVPEKDEGSEVPDDPKPPEEEYPEEPEDPEVIEPEDKNKDDDNETNADKKDETEEPKEETTEKEDPKPTPTDPATLAPSGLEVFDETTSFKKWTTLTSVDIFSQRPGNTGVSTIDGKNIIAPGAEGRYVFKIRNTEAYLVEYTIKLEEADLHNPPLPLRYRLIKGFDDGKKVTDDNWKIARDIDFSNASLNAGGDESFYTLEWKWVSKDDETDTLIGTQPGRPIYVLNIIVEAWFKVP
jgi:hypothetical protein